jgi:predicted MPP superfamily phosphohydrolase
VRAVEAKRRILTRRNALKLLTAEALGSLADACWFEPGHLSITRKDMVCPKLPPGLDGLRIGLLADFHFRPEQDGELIERVVAKVHGEKLDLVALAGDFIDSQAGTLTPLLERLEKLSAAHGVFAVMGNHDGWSGNSDVIRRQFEKAGISFLINQHSLLSVRGETLAVAGTDYVWLGKPDPARTFNGIATSTPIVAIVHEPDYFDTITAHREILLQLSGHTHGGQCRVPLTGYAPIKVKYGEKYVYGDFARGDSQLFVTRGVGTTGLRVRFACPPELAVLTLRTAREGDTTSALRL